MKKIFICLMITMSIIFGLIPGSADAATITPVVKVSGKVLNLSTKPYITAKNAEYKMGLPMFPIEPIAKALGYTTKFDKAKRILTITNTKKKFKALVYVKIGMIQIGTGEPEPFNYMPVYKNNAVYVAPAYIEKLLNATLDWWRDSKTAVIYAKGDKQATYVQRLLDSGEYYKKKQVSGYPPTYLHKGEVSQISITVQKAFSDPKTNAFNIFQYDLNLRPNYTLAARYEYQEVIKLFFPKDYKEVYHYFMMTLREEIYSSTLAQEYPGISKLKYDGREVAMMKVIVGASPSAGIAIGFKGVEYKDSPNYGDPKQETLDIQREIRENKLDNESWY